MDWISSAGPVSDLQKEFETIVIGGGIAGCSVAYHLACKSKGSVLLLEQNRISSGTTWHAAGLVGRLRTSNSMTMVNTYSAKLYESLQELTGIDVEWKKVGSLILAGSSDRMIQLDRTTSMAELFGVQCELIDRHQAQEKWPLIVSGDLEGAAWIPDDGRVNPQKVAEALAQAAQNAGATIVENTPVSELIIQNGRIVGIDSNGWRIKCKHLVLACGMWSRQLGLKYGVNIPLYPVEHHYAVSNPIDGVQDTWPVARDPDKCIYFRPENQSILLGAFQKFTKPWNIPEIPSDFSFQLLEDDWEKFDPPLQDGMKRIPSLKSSGFSKFVNGPESFTPDNNFLLGETPEVRNLYVCGGFNSAGIASAGGAGMYLSEWILNQEQPVDLWSVDIRRFHSSQNNRKYISTRVTESLGLHYQMAWPNREFESARPLRTTPIYKRQQESGAVYGSKFGWERPNFFESDAARRTYKYSFGNQNWFINQKREHLAARNNIALLDQSTFAKFEISGKESLDLLQYLCANDINIDVGNSVYTPLLNFSGGFESDVVIARMAQDRFYLISSTSQAVKDYNWIAKNNIYPDTVRVADISGSKCVLSVMGPNSIPFLSEYIDHDLSLDSFPPGSWQWVEAGNTTCMALRRSYIGEDGFEFHVPAESSLNLYNFFLESGIAHDLTQCGHYAINSLRIEKGFRAYGHELSVDENPLMAGMMWLCDLSKKNECLGIDYLKSVKDTKPRKRLFSLKCHDSGTVLWGQEPVMDGNQPISYTTSGSFGHSLGCSVGFCYLPLPESGSWSEYSRKELFIRSNGKLSRVDVSLKPFL